jgi:glycosyltransferase involved in cell wall biosynthesis
MISVLIPVYNWDVAVLVHSLREAITGIPEYGELIIGDDGSSPEFRSRYENLAGGPVRIITAEKNIGRAAIKINWRWKPGANIFFSSMPMR